MSFKKFRSADIVHNTIVAKPEFNFIIHSGNVYLNYESAETGSFSNDVKHVSQGHVSLYELNINRPADSLVKQFIQKDTTRYAYKTISASSFDDSSQFSNGDTIEQSYPLSASIGRIFVPDGQEFDINTSTEAASDSATFAADNKKYIRALRSVIESQAPLTNSGIKYGTMGTEKVNMICIPAIFYGSGISKETVELNFFVTGTLVAQAADSNGGGLLVETKGNNVGGAAGMVLYNHGLILLTGAWSQHAGYQDNYFSTVSKENPSWLSFGTGLNTIGTNVSSGPAVSSSYEIKFKGINKIPTLTMMAHADKGEFNFSHNPTFIDRSQTGSTSMGENKYLEGDSKIKNIKRSAFIGYEEEFENITYISKVGVYDENKNLIAIATFANPIKKTEFQDYMFKLRLDF